MSRYMLYWVSYLSTKIAHITFKIYNIIRNMLYKMSSYMLYKISNLYKIFNISGILYFI